MNIATECNLAQLVVDILNGKTIIFPTETSYGLGCDAANQEAVDKIFKIKGRPDSKPLLVVVPNIEMAKKYLVWNEALEKIAQKYWPSFAKASEGKPGAVTVVGGYLSDPSRPPFKTFDPSQPPLKRGGGGGNASPLFKEGAYGGGQLANGDKSAAEVRMIAFNRTKDLRRSLRKNKTNAEKIVWTCLKSKQIGGYKFRRQHGIGKYIVDFYQSDSKLIIEIDGDVHFITADQENKDRERQKWFESMGYKILRFNNVDIFNNLENILDEIYCAVSERLTPPNLPLKGEGAMATPPLFLRRGLTGEVNFGLARGVVATDNTVAIRVTAHPLLKSLTEKIGRPLVATSANISDAGDMYSSAAVIAMFKNREVRPDIILDQGNLPKNPPSTIASVVNGNLKILRQGAVYIEI